MPKLSGTAITSAMIEVTIVPYSGVSAPIDVGDRIPALAGHE